MSQDSFDSKSSLSLEAASLIGALGSGVIRVDLGRRILDINPAAEELTGCWASEAIGKTLQTVYRVAATEDTRSVEDPVDQALDQGRLAASAEERLLLRADGVELAVRDCAVPIAGLAGVAVGAWLIFEDVTEVRALQKEQRWLDSHDPVTGLANRRSFEARLEHALAEARDEDCQHVFGFVDLDDLEVFNDTFGLVAGEEMLKQVAKLLSDRLADRDTLARLGSDRFGVLIVDCKDREADDWAGRLRQDIASFRFRWQHETFEVNASVGIVPINAQSGDLIQVLGAADAASDRARDDTRQIYQFNSENSGDIFLAEHYGEMRWLSRIHRALKKGRFRLFRQSIVRLTEDEGYEVSLYEVLIRMIDEKGEIVPPNAFIQAAERFHLISTLDRWVVRTALELLEKEAKLEAPPSPVAINLSGQSLSESRFLDFVLNQLESCAVDPALLCFEITETAAVAHLDRARRFISELHARGCRFILDDFGSGLSSFAYLKNLPVDFLKIDREFVGNMVEDPLQRAIVQSIHQIGRVMGFQIIAEGVETAETMGALRTLDIDFAQGFLIDRPALWSVDD